MFGSWDVAGWNHPILLFLSQLALQPNKKEGYVHAMLNLKYVETLINMCVVSFLYQRLLPLAFLQLTIGIIIDWTVIEELEVSRHK